MGIGLIAGLVIGLALFLAGRTAEADIFWAAGVVPVLAALVVEIARSLWRGEVGLDIVAALSMSAALAFGETLAAAVVALMYSGGTFLESYAEGRARREMHDLLSRVPRSAARHRDDGGDGVARRVGLNGGVNPRGDGDGQRQDEGQEAHLQGDRNAVP